MKKLLILVAFMATFLNAEFISKEYANNIIIEKRITKINKQIEKLKKLPKLEQAREVNRFFNFAIKYTSDIKVYGKKDYKATIEETIQTMKGDCDDYAIAKIQALTYLGFNTESIMVVVSQEPSQAKHMKLYVKLEKEYYILDNLNKSFRKLSKEERKREVKIADATIMQSFIATRLTSLDIKKSKKDV